MSNALYSESTQSTVLTRQQVRAVDRIAIEQFGMSGLVLMENAARGCFDSLVRRGVRGPVVIAAGTGNNGGDGFALARHLVNLPHESPIPLKVLVWGSAAGGEPQSVDTDSAVPQTLSRDAAANLNVLLRMGVAIEFCDWQWVPTATDSALAQLLGAVAGRPVQWLVDAWLGTGARLPVSSEMARVLRIANGLDCQRMAVDIPTGMDCDEGVRGTGDYRASADITGPAERDPAIPGTSRGRPVFRADLTCTFVANKPGFAKVGAAEFLGEVDRIDIGAPRQAIELARQQFPEVPCKPAGD